MADVIDAPAPPVTPDAPTPIDAAPSIADHAAQFGPEATVEPEPPAETPAQAQQRRDRETGQFKEGKVRHRAQSQKPGVLIPQLKSELKAAQDELATLRAAKAAPAQIQAAQTHVTEARQHVQQQSAPTTGDQEPKDTDEKYGGDWSAYMRDHARWSARDEYRQQRQQESQWQAVQQRIGTFGGRVQESRKSHTDYDQIAFAQTPINPQQYPIVDAFIMDDDSGAEILYHLQSHPEERDALLRMDGLKQAKALTLLSQRFASTTTETAGTTGAASRRPMVTMPPKPPTPVRTEAQRASGTPPPTDGSLSIAEHARTFSFKRR